MILEKSVIDNMLLKDVMDHDILLYDNRDFNLERATGQLLDKGHKFMMIKKKDQYAILSSYDVLSLHMNRKSLEDKWHGAIDGGMTIKDFIEKTDDYRYFGVYSNHVHGFVDKQKILSMYQQVDDENSVLITSILDNIHMAICIIDTSCRVKFWNKSAEKLYQISREIMYNNVLTDFFPTALLPTVLDTEKKYVDVYNLPREGCHNLITASPLYQDGILIGAISYDKDISEQIKITEDLKKKESNLEVLQKELQAIGEERYTFDTMVGNDPSWVEVVKLTRMVSKSMLNILISGESGTGKEVLARAIHHESTRSGLFVPINCSAIPRDLFESELFGYESGAFSGASTSGKVGRFEFASGGTLFLDEIGDMPLEMQAKLLRVLEDGEVVPVGSNEPIKVDVRVIAASNKDLLELSDQGLFRKDLYFRLNGIGVHLAPLRERPGDIELIARKFLEDFKETYGYRNLNMSDDIMLLLKNYHWEGNIRELKNIIERMVILSKNNGLHDISDAFLPDVIRNMAIKMKVGPSYSLNDLLEKTEKEAIQSALDQSSSKAMAAKLLKIPRSTLYFKMDKYGLE
ncbi:AAA family ATPase [Acidaminobacter sp. JC074]|uniref:sigma-54 interaction domain-containing protein n=1 Tax=Acidaminobacter sp. JC074 TaxID=2530199 RepID=UPI001F0FA812|nr:sigma 54-interacting transcriptional regulator [Acidaminobacter sp. JC074]MCH4889915.1 AAA family ATPase [Acidaminobacter sp. JC074]